MRKWIALLLLLAAGTVFANPVTMANTGSISNLGGPGFFLFNVDGTARMLICDQYSPNVPADPYQAFVSTLADLTNTYLVRYASLSLSDALLRYQQVAILDSLAFADPTNLALVEAVTWTNRRIVDGVGILPGDPATPGTAAYLYIWIQTQDPAAYDLNGFRIYTGLQKVIGGNLTYFAQEQTGFEGSTPEPSTMLVSGLGLVAVALMKRARGRQ